MVSCFFSHCQWLLLWATVNRSLIALCSACLLIPTSFSSLVVHLANLAVHFNWETFTLQPCSLTSAASLVYHSFFLSLTSSKSSYQRIVQQSKITWQDLLQKTRSGFRIGDCNFERKGESLVYIHLYLKTLVWFQQAWFRRWMLVLLFFPLPV